MPVILTAGEVQRILRQLHGVHHLDDVDYSLSASVSPSLSASAGIDDGPTPVQHLKVIYVTGSRARIEDIANEAITAWEGFLSNHGISGAP